MDNNMDNTIETAGSDIMKKPALIKRLILTGQLTRFILYLSVAIPAVILIIMAILSSPYFNIIGPISIGSIKIGTPIDFVILAVIIATGILGIYETIRLRRVRKIDQRFPDFVRDVAESRRAGMTFTKAIMYAAKGNYGVLTSEIQIIARQISWGSSVDEALNAFAKRVNTKLIRRTISLIIEASRSGGNVADVLDAASKDARELKLIDSERRANLLSYVIVIYVGMFVFLIIIIVLSTGFIPAMLGQGSTGLQESMGKSANQLTVEDLNMVFLYATLIQSTGMGFVAGVFEEGNVVAGIKHVFIMVLITWIIFKVFLGV